MRTLLMGPTMTPGEKSGRALRRLAGVALLVASASVTSCSSRTLPSRGELLVLLSSDMQVPQSFDTLIVRADREPANVRHVYLPTSAAVSRWTVGQPSDADANLECQPHEGDVAEPNLLALPTTLALTNSQAKATAGKLTVTACKGNVKVFGAEVPFEIPGDGDTQLLELPIRWLCSDKGPGFASNCYGCGSTSCYGKSIEVDDSIAYPCKVSACTGDGSYPSLAYSPDLTSRFRPDVAMDGGCFDVLACFPDDVRWDGSLGSTWSAIVDWETRPTDGAAQAGPCVVQLEEDTDVANLNLALELPTGTFGTCSATHCLVPLDADSPLGFTRKKGGSTLLEVPAAICHMLDSGQVLSVQLSSKCAAKTIDSPVCHEKSPPNLTSAVDQKAPTSAGVLFQFNLDNPDPKNTALFERGVAGIDLSYSHATNAPAGESAVSGTTGLGKNLTTVGQTLSSASYCTSTRPLDSSGYADIDGFSFSLFASLTEDGRLSSSSQRAMPLLSNLSEDCRSGVRMELVPCSDTGDVHVAISLPTGVGSGGACKVDYFEYPFASRSWEWGYYSPWKRGDYRHVVANFATHERPVVFIDGRGVSEARTRCAAAPAAEVLHDQSHLVLGSNGSENAQPQATTGPLELDEVAAYDRTLTEAEVRKLNIYSTTRPGPSGLRWGTWATQGSFASFEAALPTRASAALDDRAFSSAGLFAKLGPQESLYEPGDSPWGDLSNYDEAVLAFKFSEALPPGSPFQFSLSAEHGLRQCTWQMFSSASGLYVVNLRQPSWCVDPGCGFDFRQVERASIATDWVSESTGEIDIALSALAFRKRRLAASELGTDPATNLGGRTEAESHLCWRSVSYSPRCQVRLSPFAPGRIGNEVLSCDSATSSTTPPELVADFPSDGSTFGRDFSECAFVRVCLKSRLPGPETAFLFELTHERGRTRTWSFESEGGGNCYVADLSQAGTLWPPSGDPTTASCAVADTGGAGTSAVANCQPASPEAIQQNAVRMALKIGAALELESLACCSARNDGCVEMGQTVPKGNPEGASAP